MNFKKKINIKNSLIFLTSRLFRNYVHQLVVTWTQVGTLVPMVITKKIATIYGMFVKGGGILIENLVILCVGSIHGMNLMPFC